MIKLSVVH